MNPEPSTRCGYSPPSSGAVNAEQQDAHGRIEPATLLVGLRSGGELGGPSEPAHPACLTH